MQFNGIGVYSIEAVIGDPPYFGWAEVHIEYRHDPTDTKPLLELKVPVAYDPDWTVEQIRNAALGLAKEAIEAAAQAFGSSSLQALPRIYGP